jgi:hypothetical protein
VVWLPEFDLASMQLAVFTLSPVKGDDRVIAKLFQFLFEIIDIERLITND